MRFGLNNTPLFFFGVALAILPASIYGIPINVVDAPEALGNVGIFNPLFENLELVIQQESTSSVPVKIIPEIGEVPTHLVDVVTSVPTKREVAFTEEPLNQVSLEKELPVVTVEPQVNEVGLPEKLEAIVSEQQLPLLVTVDDVQPLSGDLEDLESGTLAQVGIVKPLTEKLVSSVPVEVIPHIGEVLTYLVDVVSSIPSKLEVAYTEEPLKQILTEKELPVVPVEPQVDEVGLPEKLETIVSEQQLPLLSIETASQIDNTDLLSEKSEEVQETLKPLAIVASILHIENVQVVFPAKLLEKILAKKSNSSVHVDTDNVNALPEKLEEVITEALHPLAVIASIPQIGNIQVVFPADLVKTILLKRSLPLVHVESQPEVDDITGSTTILEEIVPEKPFVLVPVKSIQEVGSALPEKLGVVVRQPLAVTALIPNVGNIQVVFSGELLDQILAKEALSLVHHYSDVTVLPASLEETVTEKSVLLVPVELAPQVEEVVLETHKPLGVVAPIPQVDSDKVVESFLPNGVLPIPALLESLGEIVKKKPHLFVPDESTPQLEELVPEIPKPLAVVVEALHTTILPIDALSSIPVETYSQLPVVLDEKFLPVDSISQGDDVGIVIPVALPSTVVNEISNVVLVVTTPIPESL